MFAGVVPLVMVMFGDSHVPFGNVSGLAEEHNVTAEVLTVTDSTPTLIVSSTVPLEAAVARPAGIKTAAASEPASAAATRVAREWLLMNVNRRCVIVPVPSVCRLRLRNASHGRGGRLSSSRHEG
jgi:hypothetical protein